MKFLFATVMSCTLILIFILLMAAMSYVEQGYGLHPVIVGVSCTVLGALGFYSATKIGD